MRQRNWNEVVDNFDDMSFKETLFRGINAYRFEKASEIQREPLFLVLRAVCYHAISFIRRAGQSGPHTSITTIISTAARSGSLRCDLSRARWEISVFFSLPPLTWNISYPNDASSSAQV
ncbi:eukaryotic initiation factor 4A-II-like [Heptranchias perlo]|uniref:eukaryotic initiation factor 4A-II-like n=1 Tax=Heptranchias perlo TaxID=212740 RepID=UPI0035596D28